MYFFVVQLLWRLLMPIFVYLGYIQYVTLITASGYWYLFAVGLTLVLVANDPDRYEWDPETTKFFNRFTSEFVAPKKKLVLMYMVSGIGKGFMCYASGGWISDSLTMWELLGILVGVLVIVRGPKLLAILRNIHSQLLRSTIWSKKELDNLGDAPKYYNRGIDEKRAENFDEAIQSFLKAENAVKESKPDSGRLVDIYYQIAKCYMDKWEHDYREAIQYFTKALEVNQTDINSLYNRGICFGKLGCWNEAIKDFENLLSINPEYKLASIALETVYRNRKLQNSG